jgi:hypothetical protein
MQTYQVFKKFRFIYNPIIPIIFPCLWVVPFLQKLLFKTRKTKKVLLIAQNKVAADYIRDVSLLLQDDNAIDQYVTTDWFPPRHFDKHSISLFFDVPYIHIFRSLFINWDLIIFTNHPFGLGVWFAPFIKKIYINHGIHTGKANYTDTEKFDGVFARDTILRPFSKPLYDKIFVASVNEKKIAITNTPELENRIAITGLLQVDKLLKESAKRSDIRRSLAIQDTDYAIHIISTWGKDSLFQTIGKELLDEAIKLQDRFKFMLSIHPRYDEYEEVGNRNRNSILEKYKIAGLVVNENLDWEKFVISADMVISDHSSLALYNLFLLSINCVKHVKF